MKQCLIGREVELNSLQEYINSERSEFVAVYGRRRVGKTFLIRHAAEEKFTFFMTGVYKASKTEHTNPIVTRTYGNYGNGDFRGGNTLLDKQAIYHLVKRSVTTDNNYSAEAIINSLHG